MISMDTRDSCFNAVAHTVVKMMRELDSKNLRTAQRTSRHPLQSHTIKQTSVANTCCQRVWLYNTATCSFLFTVLLILAMTFTSVGDSSSIFKDGNLKPGIYKIQNLYNETFLDVQEHSREIYCRSVQDLREGMGLVRRCPSPVVRG